MLSGPIAMAQMFRGLLIAGQESTVHNMRMVVLMAWLINLKDRAA